MKSRFGSMFGSFIIMALFALLTAQAQLVTIDQFDVKYTGVQCKANVRLVDEDPLASMMLSPVEVKKFKLEWLDQLGQKWSVDLPEADYAFKMIAVPDFGTAILITYDVDYGQLQAEVSPARHGGKKCHGGKKYRSPVTVRMTLLVNADNGIAIDSSGWITVAYGGEIDVLLLAWKDGEKR